jgi:hypothetical protein
VSTEHAIILWRRRWFALAFTIGMMVLSSAGFTLLFNNSLDQKPAFLLRMLCGPLGHVQNLPNALVGLSILCLVLLYPAFPSRGTFALTCVGLFFWWGSGFVAATGGV